MRQNVIVNPASRLFEAFLDFSGGRNTEITNEKLKDNEYPILLNADLSGRASARLRYGRVDRLSVINNYVGQGIFFYYREGQPYPNIIFAASGRLYLVDPVDGQGQSTVTEIPIFDGATPFTFQAVKTVEAVQYAKIMFIATGTKLVELTYNSGWVAKVVVPYAPTAMEAIYIGTNGLAANPDTYIQNGISPTSDVEAIGIKPAKRTGAVNVPIQMTAYINVPVGYAGTVDYKWEFKKELETTYIVEKDFIAGNNANIFNFVSAGNYDIRITVRKTGTTTPLSQFVLPDFPIKQVADVIGDRPTDRMNTCRKILLHWDRIIVYGDDTYPYQTYISDLEAPRYFPKTNTISFDTGKLEPLNALVRFQDMLAAFTSTTIQTLVGKSPEDYRRFQIHDGIGCIAGWSAKVVGNNIYFLSHEGVQALKPNPYRLETMNVVRVDGSIRSEVPSDEDACGGVADNMYWLCFPQKKIVFRFYYETGIAVRDESDGLNIKQFLNYGEDVYNLTTTGNLMMHNENVWKDGIHTYYMDVETKGLDLSASFNYKKLKRIYVLARHFKDNQSEYYVTVKADSAIVLTPDTGRAEVDEATGNTVWIQETNPNFHFYTGTTFGQWIVGVSSWGEVDLSVQKAAIRGKCRRVKVRFKSTPSVPCELFGFGLEFKPKRP